MTRDIPEEVHHIVAVVSRNVHRRFRNWIDFEDIQQEAYLWCLSKPRKVTEYLDDGKQGEKKLTLSLRRHCEQQARKAKAAANGGHYSDEFFYEISQLSELLPLMFDRENWLEQPQDFGADKVSGTREPAEGGNWLTTMVDVSTAYEALTIEDRRLLRRYYWDEWTFKMIADAEQVEPHQARKAVYEALVHLLDELGGASPWTGKDYK